MLGPDIRVRLKQQRTVILVAQPLRKRPCANASLQTARRRWVLDQAERLVEMMTNGAKEPTLMQSMTAMNANGCKKALWLLSIVAAGSRGKISE